VSESGDPKGVHTVGIKNDSNMYCRESAGNVLKGGHRRKGLHKVSKVRYDQW